MTGSATAVPARRRWTRILVAQIAALGLLLLLLEGGARVWRRIEGHPWNAAQARSEIERVHGLNQLFTPRPEDDLRAGPADRPGAQPILHPFLGWEIRNGLEQLDAELARLREPGRKTGRERDFEVLVLGGSVAQAFAQEDLGGARLRERLSADARLAGREVHLLKFGRGGYKQPQQADGLVYLLTLGFEPEAVLNIDGFNEVALGLANAAAGSHPVFPSTGHWAHLASFTGLDRDGLDIVIALRGKQRAVDDLAGFALERGLWRSCLAGSLALHRLYALRNECIAGQQRYEAHLAAATGRMSARGPSFAGGAEEAVLAGVRSWSEDSRAIAAICAARSIPYLHVLQPTMLDPGSKPLTPDEVERGRAVPTWVEAARAGYPRLREAGARLREGGEAFLDASMLFRGRTEELYVDACHYNAAGHRILADEIATALLALLRRD